MELRCCKLQNKENKVLNGELKAKLNIDKLFSEIENNPNFTFIIPKCFNCNELLRKDDLEVLAEKSSAFDVADSISKHYGKSLVQMQTNKKANYEEE